MIKRVLMKKIQHKSTGVSKIIGSLALAMGLLLMASVPAMATEEIEYDDVIINGHKLGFFDQLALESHMDREIPDGNYWYELETGLWGHVGGPAIGHIKVPEDYRDYIKSKFFKIEKASNVELSASAEGCENDCLYW